LIKWDLSKKRDVKSTSAEHIEILSSEIEAMVLFQDSGRVRGGPNPLNGVLEVFLTSGSREKVLLRECFQDLSCSVPPFRGGELELVDVIVLSAMYLG